MTGVKLDLKRRLAKLLQQEETPMETNANEEKEHSTVDVDKLRKDIELKYQMPTTRSILVHPTDAKGDKFDCRVVSLHYLLNYANKDTIHEKCFEVKRRSFLVSSLTFWPVSVVFVFRSVFRDADARRDLQNLSLVVQLFGSDGNAFDDDGDDELRRDGNRRR